MFLLSVSECVRMPKNWRIMHDIISLKEHFSRVYNDACIDDLLYGLAVCKFHLWKFGDKNLYFSLN